MYDCFQATLLSKIAAVQQSSLSGNPAVMAAGLQGISKDAGLKGMTNGHTGILQGQHPLLILQGQHPLLILQGQHPLLILQGQHPLLILQGQHPLLILQGQHPLLIIILILPEVVVFVICLT